MPRATRTPRNRWNPRSAVGVPGTVAGLALAHEKFGSGKLGLAELIAPAVALARDGVPVEDDTAASLPSARARLARWPASMKIFFKPDGALLGPGDRLVQTDLAATLEAIARNGPRAFYEGGTAEKLVAALRAAGGVMTLDDLKNYRAVLRTPLRGSYRGYDILSMPPPSSGGVHLIEMLNILEGYDLRAIAADRGAVAHLMIEAMKRAYADRAIFLGRSRLGESAGRRPHFEILCRGVAGPDRSRTRARFRRDPRRRSRAARRRQHHAFFGDRPRGQCGVQHLHAQSQLRRRHDRRRHRHSAQQRARRFRVQADGAECLRPCRYRCQCARPGQTPAVIDDTDNRAEGRPSRS